MPQTVTITLDYYDFSTIQSALHKLGGDLAAREMERTGGAGFASGGTLNEVAKIQKIREAIRVAMEESNTQFRMKKEEETALRADNPVPRADRVSEAEHRSTSLAALDAKYGFRPPIGGAEPPTDVALASAQENLGEPQKKEDQHGS